MGQRQGGVARFDSAAAAVQPISRDCRVRELLPMCRAEASASYHGVRSPGASTEVSIVGREYRRRLRARKQDIWKPSDQRGALPDLEAWSGPQRARPVGLAGRLMRGANQQRGVSSLIYGARTERRTRTLGAVGLKLDPSELEAWTKGAGCR